MQDRPDVLGGGRVGRGEYVCSVACVWGDMNAVVMIPCYVHVSGCYNRVALEVCQVQGEHWRVGGWGREGVSCGTATI